MPLDVSRIKTITLDSYSTLLDVDSAANALRGKISNPDEVAGLWRSESLIYGMLCNFYGTYESFYDLNRHALDYALKIYNVAVTAEMRDDILSIYHKLNVFPDVTEGVQGLRDLGYPVYVLSNGDPDMLKSLVKLAKIENIINDFISVDEIKKYKPAPELYLHGAKRTGTDPENIAHISAGWFDFAGAQQVGMQGIWMNRKHEEPRVFGPKPDLEVSGFKDILSVLSAK